MGRFRLDRFVDICFRFVDWTYRFWTLVKFMVVNHSPSADPADFGVARSFVQSVDPFALCKDQSQAAVFDLERATQLILRLSNPARKLSLVPVIQADPVA